MRGGKPINGRKTSMEYSFSTVVNLVVSTHTTRELKQEVQETVNRIKRVSYHQYETYFTTKLVLQSV